ncbi:MAG TPA: phytoene/squalene synthase family protein [Caulobacteraceae bacterium]|nr:phytoene/squalene synthase family protein [Caulobacteraceae bacterium]
MFKPRFAQPADSAACRELIRGGSKSFFLASLLLPEPVREAAYAVYGFCRLSDDAVDVDGGSHAAVARLRARLDRIYAGAPAPEPVDRALADVALNFALPRVTLDALLEGLEWDAQGRTYETLSDVYAYSTRVAGSVGAMMAALLGARTPDLVARACDLGVAMQLTNIARDVGEDARAGRLYLPRAWLREAGLDPDAWLAKPVFNAQIAQVTQRLLRRADELYARADEGIAGLDRAFRPAIFAARYLYAEIGTRLEQQGLDSISRRTTVPIGRKAQLLVRAAQRAHGGVRGASFGPPLAETRFLVEAVALEAPSTTVSYRGRRASVGADMAWMIELFSTLHGRARAPKPAR